LTIKVRLKVSNELVHHGVIDKIGDDYATITVEAFGNIIG